MKKNGFTLAEVLVTLGIIGVIAALTLPTFTASTSMTKIGPMLGKAKSSFEQATTAMLNEAQSDSLSSAMLCPELIPNCTVNQRDTVVGNSNVKVKNFFFNLSHYLKGQWNGGTIVSFISEDGIEYTIDSADWVDPTNSQFPYDETIYSEVRVDINGKQGPNRESRDIFYFELRNDGSLVPWGKKINSTTNVGIFGNWETNCPKNATPTQPGACAAHIFENGLKAEYR